jgi:hypothetical protein
LSAVDRERTITERSMGFVPYSFGEASGRVASRNLREDRHANQKDVMPSHKVNGRTEHRTAQVKFFEVGNVLDSNPVEDPDHFFTLQRRLDDYDHLLLDCSPESVDKT